MAVTFVEGVSISGAATINLNSGDAFVINEPDKDQPGRLIFDYSNGDPTLTIASRASTAKLHLRRDATTGGFYLDEDGNMYVNGSMSDGVKINSTCLASIGTNAQRMDLGSTTRPWGDIYLGGAIGVNVTPSTTDGRIDASNDIVAYSTSDIRLKDNIKSIDKALDKVNKIQGIEFDWVEKEEVHGNSGHDVGVIAQEIEKILPEVVTTRDNGYKAVKYEKIVPLLIEAIKDLSKQVDGLKRLI